MLYKGYQGSHFDYLGNSSVNDIANINVMMKSRNQKKPTSTYT